MWLGEMIVCLSSVIALGCGIYTLIFKKPPMFFQLIIGAIACHILGYLFDICEFFTQGTLSGGYTIGYLGSIGCFLFLLTAGFGYLDGIMDDRTGAMRKSRLIALLAPLFAVALLVVNMLSDIPTKIKIAYFVLWIPAMFNSYFCLKHAILPDMGFGFVKAIRPYNIAALTFTLLQLVHLTLWSFFGWVVILISGIFFGLSIVLMMIMARRGAEKWTI